MQRTIDEVRAERNAARLNYKRVCRERTLDSPARGRAWLEFLELDDELHELKRSVDEHIERGEES